ncbi:MAG: hypothetical protein MJY58_00290 [Bacteroidaceae bacterium]|nr:hypothetical protein [Bacteroidaceae bacterium]
MKSSTPSEGCPYETEHNALRIMSSKTNEADKEEVEFSSIGVPVKVRFYNANL